MIFKSLKALLISLPFLFSAAVACADIIPDKSRPLDVMPESPKMKSQRVEREVNEMFQRGFRTASVKMDVTGEIRPFAVIQKKDGKYGVFSTEINEKTKDISIDSQAASIRKYLIELVVADQIDASMQVMFATILEEGKPARQGLVFEIEHQEGVSLLRFLPVSKIKDEQGADSGKLLFEMESMSTAAKPQVVFAYAKAT
jgi:hypothetical protein